VLGRIKALGLDLLQRSQLLWRVNLTVLGEMSGTPIAIPILFGNGVQHIRSGEPWMSFVLERLLRVKPGAFVDVGANLGQTLLKAKTLDRARPYYAFEPNPEAAWYLGKLVEQNDFECTYVFPIGLSDRSMIVRLFSKADADPSASIVDGFRSADRYSRSQFVSVHRGDDVLATMPDGPIAVVKVDVEGAELDVLRGLQTTLASKKPCVLCEVLPVYDPNTDTGRLRVKRQTELRRLLSDVGYLIYRLGRDGDIELVDDFGVHSDIARSNYLFAPASEPTVQFGNRPRNEA
jgi:FkbM family methyltransferase